MQDAFLDTKLKFYGSPDPYFVNQWNLTKTRVDRAWEITAGDSSLVIAIMDRGVEMMHEDLADCIWINDAELNGTPGFDDDHNGCIDDFNGCDFASNLNDPSTDNDPSPDDVEGEEHGTAVAGIACAARDNGKGVAGVCGGAEGNRPRLLPIRVKWASDMARAFRYILRTGVDVVNMSGGGFSDPGGVCAALVDSAYANGTVFFAAIGNNGNTVAVYPPATFSNVIAVGATDENDVKTCSSNYGEYLDIMGPSTVGSFWQTCDPGPYIWTTDNSTDNSGQIGYNPGYPGCANCASEPPDNEKYWARFDGTSAACPLVSGVAVLLKSHMPTLTSSAIRQRIENAATDLGSPGWDEEYGNGRVDAYRALTEWGTITGEVTWSPSDTHDGTRYVSGDLTIAPGATLTVMPGTVIKVAGEDDLAQGSDSGLVEIIVQGTLIANGTSVAPILFQNWKSTTSPGWVGIRIEAGGAATLDNCRIKHAIVGVATSVDLALTNTVVDSCLTGVLAGGGALTLQNCSLSDVGVAARFDSLSAGGKLNYCTVRRAEYGIDSYAPVAVRHTDIDSCAYAGIVARDGSLFVKDSNVTHSGTFGVSLTGGTSVIRSTLVDIASSAGLDVHAAASLTLRGSTVQNCDTGLYVNGDASVDVDSTCYIWMNDTGIHLYNAGSSSSVKRTGVTWNASTAILCDNSSPRIDSLTIAHNGSGIYCTNGAAPVIEWNKIQSSGAAVTALSSARPEAGPGAPGGSQSSGNNSIAFTSTYVANYTDSTIYAQHNCWNVNVSPCNPAVNRFVGSVDRTDPKCCSFPQFPRGEGEPEFTESAVVLPPQDALRLTRKPAATALLAIVPNPFNPTTTVQYSLAERGRVEVNVYDVSGKLVQVLANTTQDPGSHAAVWNGTDRRGSPVASGVYFVRMVAANQVFTRKMVLLK